MRVKDNAKWWKNRRHTYMLHKCEENWKSIRVPVVYKEPIPTWIFPMQGTHGSYTVNTCARTRFVYFSRTNRGRWKKQSHDDKKTTNTHSTPRDRGNLRSNTTFRRFDMFRLILLCITNAGSATFSPQDTQSLRGAQLAAGVELLLPLLLRQLRDFFFVLLDISEFRKNRML